MRRALAAAFAMLAWMALATPALANRVALVIGNSAYASLSTLINPASDAAAIAGALRAHGFEVYEYYDLNRADMLDALESFRRVADTAEVAMAYYAGHGLELNGRNVIAPVDMEISCETREARRAVEMESLFQSLGRAPQQVVLLDACRNDPFPQCPTRSTQTGSGFRGFSLVRDEDRSIIIANATLSGQLAADGAEGGHSPFAEALLARMETNGNMYLRDLLDTVARDVRVGTGGQQIPEITTQGGAPRVCIDEANCGAGGNAVATPADPAMVAEAETLLAQLGHLTRGEGLADSVMRFQAVIGLPQDGAITPTLLALLRATAQTQVAVLNLPVQGGNVIPPIGPTPSVAYGTVFRDCPNCPEVVAVPGGAFRMGAGQGEAGGVEEGPLHDVTITRPLAISKFEITFDDWEACAFGGGCGNYRPEDGGWGRGRHPVVNVSFDDAKAYVDWLRRTTGENYRLLSEAEWEYAARGGTTTPFAYGEAITTAQANFDGSTLRGGEYAARTLEVGQYPPNPFGLYDMHGNAAEWVEDCWNPSHAGAPPDGSNRGGDCTRRVLKGGAWYYEAAYLRSAARLSFPAGSRLNIAGFRIARPL